MRRGRDREEKEKEEQAEEQKHRRMWSRGRGFIRVLTEPWEQWSVSPLLKRAMSLMKTAVALRMKDIKRCIWM